MSGVLCARKMNANLAQWEDAHGRGKTNTDVRGRDMGIEEGTGKSVNNNGRNGRCLTWLAISLEEKRRWLIIN